MGKDNDSELIADLLWAMWGQLGISSVIKMEQEPLLDVEPLILLTAWFINQDLRLSEEVIRWCAGYAEWVSKTRLTSLYRSIDAHWQQHFDNLSAAVYRANDNVKWPGYQALGKAAAPHEVAHSASPAEPSLVFAAANGPPLTPFQNRLSFHRPGNLRFRLRALVGVGTRADVLTHLIFSAMAKGSDLAYLGYSKPAIAQALSSLEQGGFLVQKQEANAYTYAVCNRQHWESILQYQATHFLNLHAIGNILVTWHRRRKHQNFSSRTAMVADAQAAKTISAYAGQLNPIRASWEPTHGPARGNSDLDAISHWIHSWPRNLPGPMGPALRR